MKLPIILASASLSRLSLLRQVGIEPDKIISANIDKTENRFELPKNLALRLSIEKATVVANDIDRGIIIGSDTVPVVGRTAMKKANSADDVRKNLTILSQRRHQIYSSVCLIKKENNQEKKLLRIVKSIIKFKKLSKKEIDYYCASGEGIGKAGGYSILGHAESFISFLSGSFSNIVGLALVRDS